MRPLPRLHAITDSVILAAPDFGVRAAAIAAAGPAVALHARTRDSGTGGGTGGGERDRERDGEGRYDGVHGHERAADGKALAAATARLLALARPPEAAVFVNGRADIAAALGAHGVQLGAADLEVADARRIFRHGWIGCSVHDIAEAEAAVAAGADMLLVGNVYETASHPGRPATGLALVEAAATLGRPVIAIGGVTPERAAELRAAGAYGVAAIRALWYARDAAAAAAAMLRPWTEDE